MRSTSRARQRAGERRRLVQTIGRDVSRFQEASYAFDDVAAEILALNRSALPIMTMLLFSGLHRPMNRRQPFTSDDRS